MTPLPRRAVLGAELPADEAFTPSGAVIAAVDPGGMAERAGLRAGDTLVTLADLPVRSPDELAAALRRAGEGATATLRFARGTAALAGTTDVELCPLEEVEGVGVSYGELAAAGARLRLIATRVPEPRACALLLPGVGLDSVEAESPLATLAHAWARAGLDTVRFDRRGIGDSEGGPASASDHEAELADAGAALEAARARAAERGVPVVLFGQGTGALVAAVLAAAHPVAGVIAVGAPSARWLRSLAAAEHRVRVAAGASPADGEAAGAALAALARTAGALGRCAAYHAQLDAIDPIAAFGALAAPRAGGARGVPVLLLRGEYDALTTSDDAQRLAAAVGPGGHSEELAGLDHLLGWHPDREASVRDLGAGRAHDALARTTLAWIASLVEGARGE
jgi:hypothetical protein